MNVDVFKAIFWVTIQKCSRIILGTIICFFILIGPTDLFLHIPVLGIIKIIGWIVFTIASIYIAFLFITARHWENEPEPEGVSQADTGTPDALVSFLKEEGIRCPGFALITLALLGAKTSVSTNSVLVMCILGAILIVAQLLTKTHQKSRPDI